MSEKELRENRSRQVGGVKRAAGKPQHAGGVKRKERSASMACLQTKLIKREVRREREEKKRKSEK